MNMEEKEAQTAMQLEAGATYTEEDTSKKAVSAGGIDMQEMIRQMMVQINNKLEEMNKK